MRAEVTDAAAARCGRILRERGGGPPFAHIVLGSGLGGLADRVENPAVAPFAELPGFPRASVEGHAGEFVLGRLGGVPVAAQSGRFHYYEGHASDAVLLPVRAARAAGARAVILTNAAGGIRRDLLPGTLMLVDDHLMSAMFRAPLAGPPRAGEERFPDMSRPYDPAFMALAETAALEAGVALPRGVYGAVHGPAFETPAEVRALMAAGADAVGMSTAPETAAARAGGQRVLAFSLITNRAAGMGLGAIDHGEVMAYGAVAGRMLGALLETLLPRMSVLAK